MLLGKIFLRLTALFFVLFALEGVEILYRHPAEDPNEQVQFSLGALGIAIGLIFISYLPQIWRRQRGKSQPNKQGWPIGKPPIQRSKK